MSDTFLIEWGRSCRICGGVIPRRQFDGRPEKRNRYARRKTCDRVCLEIMQSINCSAINVGRKRSPESIAKTVAAHLGSRRSPQTCANIGASLRGKKQTPEHIEAAAAARRGIKRSAETGRKISAALAGRKQTPEHIANGVLARTGLKHTSEQKAQRSARMIGKKLPSHWIAAIVNGLTGKLHSDERRAMNQATQRKLATLTEDGVREIRATYTGVKGQISDYAARFGVSRATIHHVLDNTRWFDPNYRGRNSQ